MIEKDDPRLATYALGEMEGEEKSAFEQELETSSDAQAELDELRETADLLSAAHRASVESAPKQLDEEQRAKILAAAGSAGSSDAAPKPAKDDAPSNVVQLTKKSKRSWWLPFSGLAAAAAVGALFLTSASERYEDSASAEAVAQAPREGSRAKGEEGSMGNPSSKENRNRYGVKGPADSQAPGGRVLKRKSGDMGTPGIIQPGPISSDSDGIAENPFILTNEDPKSTFSVDVDTASYSMIRRSLREGRDVAPESIRIEEMVNYFSYDYPPPEDEAFGANFEVTEAPWAPEHRLVRVGIKGREVPVAERPNSNLVLLLDVSGSMNSPDKLPLVIKAMDRMTAQLGDRDSVAIVVYAGATGVVLPPTNGRDSGTIREALRNLSAGGSTNGGAGIQRAYDFARASFIEGGTNRVILATDGDFNVGIDSRDDLIKLIEKEAKSGVFLTVLGFGTGNVKDTTLEQLADKGNGNYAYIDTFAEARKVLVEQISGTLVTIAKDVKLQLEFSKEHVEKFRLIGYENRVLAHSDFEDDTKDAGEIGAGHTVTALYEVVPRSKIAPDTEFLGLKIRYKQPDGDTSSELEFTLKDAGGTFDDASQDHRLAASVASFGMLLRNSPHKGAASFDQISSVVETTLGNDPREERAEFLELVKLAKQQP